jgi:hypothetical protein
VRLKRWSAPDLLIIDDVGLGQVKKRQDEPKAAHTLFNLNDGRHAKSSTAVTSNIKFGSWGRYLGDAALAAAVLDRLAMHAIRKDIDGPRIRQQVARDRAEERDGQVPQGDELVGPSPSPPSLPIGPVDHDPAAARSGSRLPATRRWISQSAADGGSVKAPPMPLKWSTRAWTTTMSA